MDILYFIKKVVANVISPLPIILILLIYSCFIITREDSRKKLKFSLYSATLGLLLFTSPAITNFLLKPLEESYPVYQDTLNSIDNIVLLGCYNRTDENRPLLDNIHDCSKSRMLEAIRLSRVYPDAKIYTSGYRRANDIISHAEYIKNALVMLGVQEQRIVAISGSLDTRQESINLRQHISGQMNLLVTEASHLKRAVALFQEQNIKVIPVPVRYLTVTETDSLFSALWPDVSSLTRAQRLVYEILGNGWVWFKGLFS